MRVVTLLLRDRHLVVITELPEPLQPDTTDAELRASQPSLPLRVSTSEKILECVVLDSDLPARSEFSGPP